jgi:hypothetical protein
MDDTTRDTFDRVYGNLEDLPDVLQTKPTTIRSTLPIVGEAQTFIVQTMRQKERGDTIFLEYVDKQGSRRIVLPSAVADTIARQRDALTDKSRSKAAKEVAQARKDRGELPGFMKDKRQRGDAHWTRKRLAAGLPAGNLNKAKKG